MWSSSFIIMLIISFSLITTAPLFLDSTSSVLIRCLSIKKCLSRGLMASRFRTSEFLSKPQFSIPLRTVAMTFSLSLEPALCGKGISARFLASRTRELITISALAPAPLNHSPFSFRRSFILTFRASLSHLADARLLQILLSQQVSEVCHEVSLEPLFRQLPRP